MSKWSGNAHPVLQGAEGELVSIRITVEPRSLERVLDVLACLDFPINPELSHQDPVSVVEFPAWTGRIPEVREALRRGGFDPSCVNCRSMIELIHPSSDGRRRELRATA
jgi:hypothetical protein